MKQGKLTLEQIKKNYHVIDKNSHGFELMEHNVYGEERIIAVHRECKFYCYTEESLDYTMVNDDEFTWYRMKDM